MDFSRLDAICQEAVVDENKRITLGYIGYIYIYVYMCYICIWVNYTDLTATSLESWLVREIIPKWPYFRLVNYYNLPRCIYIYIMDISGQ